MPITIIRSFLNQAKADGAKTSVLSPLQWLIGLLLGGLVLNSIYGKAQWINIFLIIVVSILVLVYIGFYVYFAGKNPDLLRSETYSLSKMAIEKGLLGDNIHGLIEAHDSIDRRSSLLAPNVDDGRKK